MTVEIDEIDFEKVFFLYKKMGLQNVENHQPCLLLPNKNELKKKKNENKCWANVSAQTLKACSCFRNIVIKKNF